MTTRRVIALKDNGHGVTRESLDFWRANRDRIGPILSVEVQDDLYVEPDPEKGYPVEYPCAVYGVGGMIRLSGCTCGYGGEGPHGTAKILEDIGVHPVQAQRMVQQKAVAYHTHS